MDCLANWLLLSQDELYEWCADSCSPFDTPAVSSWFHKDSPPYLFATEYPWDGLASLGLKDRSVLTIAGSADVPFQISTLGAKPIIAADISHPACCVNELKRAALRHFSWEEFLAFFLTDLPHAHDFLRSKGLGQSMPANERAAMYLRARAGLSSSAEAFWDHHVLGKQETPSPFYQFVRSTDLFFLHQVPYLQQKEVYEAWRIGLADYPILNLPLERVMDCSDAAFDLIYASNILEYWKTQFLMNDAEPLYADYLYRFFDKAIKALKPAGRMCFYVFKGMTSTAFDLGPADFPSLLKKGLELSIHEIEYSSPQLSKSFFHNTLLVFKKT